MRVINQERSMPDRLRIKTRKKLLLWEIWHWEISPNEYRHLHKTQKSMQRVGDWNGSHEYTLFPQMLRTENLME